MASENLKVDENHKPVIGMITDDSNQFIKMGRIDDATKGLKVMIVGGTGAGTVTSVTAGTGLTATPNPIVGAGTIALANTAVTPGSYTLSSITVDAQGRITSASNGTASGTGTVTSVSVTTASGVSGSVATATTTPAITIILGAITPTSVNGLTITTTTGTLTVTNGKTLSVVDTTALGTSTILFANGKTMTFNNSLTLSGTDGEALVLTKGLTVTTNAGTIAFGAASKTLTISDSTTLATSAITFGNTKTLTVSNSLTLAGTDSTVMTFPTTSATIARTDAGNTFTGVSTGTAWVLTSPTITTKISPTSDDGAPLGDTTHNFSDLFLASGAVINYQNGNVVITQTSGILTMGTGDFRVSSAGTNSASVVTVGGTQTITNKSIAETQITFTDITTGNVSTSNHGFTPKLPNDATKFLDGTGAYTVPTGSGTSKIAFVTTAVTLTAGGGNPETTIVSVTIPAGTLSTANAIKGKVFMSDMVGKSSDEGTLTFKLKYGGTTIGTTPGYKPVINTTGSIDDGFIDFVIYANAATNAQIGNMIFHASRRNGDPTVSGAGLDVAHQFAAGTAAVDSTASQTLLITAQWSVGVDIINSMVMRSAIIEKVS